MTRAFIRSFAPWHFLGTHVVPAHADSDPAEILGVHQRTEAEQAA